MKTRSFLGWFVSLVVAGMLAGCGSSSSGGGGAPVAPVPGGGATGGPEGASIDAIRVGEKITVIVADIPQPYNHQQQVREDGTISLPLDVVVTAAGKRKNELQEEIRSKYVPKFFQRCTVTVETEERFIYVSGYVRAPGRYPYAGEMTALRAVSVAGGFNEFSNKKKVLITRPGGSKRTVDCKRAETDPSFDVAVFPGDSVFVPKKFW